MSGRITSESLEKWGEVADALDATKSLKYRVPRIGEWQRQYALIALLMARVARLNSTTKFIWKRLTFLWSTLMAALHNVDDYLSGYDIFISYAWGDGENYPHVLAEDLRKLRYKVFLDKDVFKAGDDLRAATRRRVRMSSLLLVVLRENVLESEWVSKEVAECRDAGRNAIVININGTFESAPPDLPLIKNFQYSLRINEALPQRDAGPSLQTVKKIDGSFTFVKSETRRTRSIAGTALVLVALMLIGGYFFVLERQQRALKLAARLEASGESASQLAETGAPEQGISAALAGLADFVRESDPNAKLPDALTAGLSKSLDATTELVSIQEPIHAAAIWPDGHSFLLLDSHGMMNIYREDGRKTNTVRLNYDGFPVRLSGAKLCPDQSGAILAWGADKLPRVFGGPDYTNFHAYGQSDFSSEIMDAVRHYGVAGAGFTPDGSQIWSVGQDGVCRVFARTNPAVCAWQYGPYPEIYGGYLAPNGQFLALRTAKPEIRMFRRTNGTIFAPIPRTIPWTNNPTDFFFLPDSAKTMMCYNDGSYELRPVEGGPAIKQRPFQGPFRSALTKDGHLILAAASPFGGSDCKIIDPETGSEFEVFHLAYQPLKIESLPQNSGFVVAGDDTQVHMLTWSGAELRQYGTKFTRMAQLYLSDDGERLLATDFEGEGALHETFGLGPVLKSRLFTNLCARAWFMSSGSNVLALFANGDLDVLNANSLIRVEHLADVGRGISNLLLSQAIYSTNSNEILYFNGEQLQRIEASTGAPKAHWKISPTPTGQFAMGFCGDSNAFFCASQYSNVFILDHELKTIATIPNLTNDTNEVVFEAKASDALVVGGLYGSVRVYDPRTGAERSHCQLFERSFDGYSAVPGCSRVVFTGDFGQFAILDLSDGSKTGPTPEDAKVLKRYTACRAWLGPGASVFVLGHALGSMELRSATNGSLICELSIPKENLGDVLFSQDGKFIFVSTPDGIVRQFSQETGSLHSMYNSHAGTPIGIAAAPNSDRVLSWGLDGRIVVWSVSDADLVRKAIEVFANSARQGIVISAGLDDASVVGADLRKAKSKLMAAFLRQ
jgi:WD40 repeat protein